MSQTLQPLDPFDISHLAHLDRETLKARLKLFIHELLQHDFERLCSLMYRHDVKESLFNEALLLSTDVLRAGMIAELVIERELEKVAMRVAYARSKKRTELED